MVKRRGQKCAASWSQRIGCARAKWTITTMAHDNAKPGLFPSRAQGGELLEAPTSVTYY